MPPASVTSRLAAAAAPGFVLERSEAVPALIGRHQDFLFIAGLGGTACDVGASPAMAPTSIPSAAPWARPA